MGPFIQWGISSTFPPYELNACNNRVLYTSTQLGHRREGLLLVQQLNWDYLLWISSFEHNAGPSLRRIRTVVATEERIRYIP